MRETIPVRTKQEDWPFLCDADTIKHGKVYVARQDHRQSGARFKRGAVLIRARFPGTLHVEGYDIFNRGLYSADEGLTCAAVKMLTQRGQLGYIPKLVFDQQLRLYQNSRLTAEEWRFLTAPLLNKLKHLKSERGTFRNHFMRELSLQLSMAASGVDRRGRRNLGAAAARLQAAAGDARARMVELERIRHVTLARSRDVWGEIARHTELFDTLRSRLGQALFHQRPPVGALLQPDEVRLHELVAALAPIAVKLGNVVAQPFAEVARLCARDIAELCTLIRSMRSWLLTDAVHVAARRLGLALYAAARAVTVHDELCRERKLVAVGLALGRLPPSAVHSVQAACDVVHSWVQLVPSNEQLKLDHPFQELTAGRVRAARNACDELARGVSDHGAALRELKGALEAACSSLMFGEVAG